MNDLDLDLIADLAPVMPLAGPEDLASARDRLTLALAAEAHGGPGRMQPRRRAALAGVAAVAVAAGVVLVLVLGSSPSAGRRTPSVAQSTSRPSAHVTLPATLTAAQFLQQGATALRREHAAAPKPNQYVYAETEGPGGSSRYQIWQSVDGSRPGLIKPVGLGPVSMSPCTLAQTVAGKCSLAAGYLPQLPTTGRALFAFLVKIGYATTGPSPKGIPNWLANNLGKDVASLMQDEYLSPAQQAGLYELIAHTQGFTLVRHVTDALGRSGVGIAWRYEHIITVIIIDPRTYGFLGVSTIKDGHLVPGWALVTKTIVSKLAPYVLPANPHTVLAKCKTEHLSKAECRGILAKLVPGR